MNYREFVNRYSGVEIDFDNMYGAQCVDLARFYWQKCCGLNRSQQPNTTPSGGAKDLINNVKAPLRVRGKEESPQEGDVVIFGETKTNPWGHVAVVIEINGSPECQNLVVFEQDGLNQGKGAYRKVRPVNDLISGYITMEGV